MSRSAHVASLPWRKPHTSSMPPAQSAPRLRLTLALGVGILIVLAIGMISIARTSLQSPEIVPLADIPLPFGQDSSLKSQLTPIGTKGGRLLVDMTFDAGEVSQVFGTNDITFALTPADASSFSDGAPLSTAFTPGTRFYGYKYTTINAAKEREMKILRDNPPLDANNVPTAYTYSQLFPGKFFASDDDLADENSFPRIFARSQGVIFHSLSELTLDANSRYLVIAEEASAPDSPLSNTALTARGLAWCGDGRIQSPEICDDGNRVASDGCSTQCSVEIGYVCSGERSICTVGSTVSFTRRKLQALIPSIDGWYTFQSRL